MPSTCTHITAAEHRHHPVVPSDHGCTECLASGSSWVHLRLCLTCGHVGCCDDSPNRHATKHNHATAHPVIRSFEPGEEWGYCYPDDAFAERMPALAGEAATRHYGR
ncbi:MAG TPA: UBP-type zinc finger domain-containing protein [Polyangiaceae bacterium]